MTRYKWAIQTADKEATGKPGIVFLSLHGLDAGTSEIKLPARQFAQASVESGIISVNGDLGELQTANLRQDGGRRAWAIDSLKITNLTDGREWTAPGAESDQDGGWPLLRFKKTTEALEENQADTEKDEPADGRAPAEQDSDDSQDGEQDQSGDKTPEPTTGQGVMDRLTAIEKTLGGILATVNQSQALLASLADIVKQQPQSEDTPDADESDTSRPTSLIQFQTLELFGMQGDRRVALSAILTCRKGQPCEVAPGAHVLVTENPSEGFGLAGLPGAWASASPEKMPDQLGLDRYRGVVAWDGGRAWPLDAEFLMQIFGAEWRSAVYSDNAPVSAI